ncbi:hypothetical protein [Aquimarina sp. 2201CG14-23]|uniref:hypothetical protein n=1 Tax=Aquimarina mycalae TaxID=3040073 RepID=UPI002477FAEE|nr:hypothetical protein [Aquimarina sp. 2201CG14-23]MDH7445004.1 hypothetical protein [Aquimarina sp. 2201CG14-23]
MMKKWYFGTLLAAFALLVVMQQQAVVPNQEIVLEFTNVDVSSLEAQNAIAIVKKQLQSVGAKNTRVSKELKEGTLKITYYSDADVEFIRKTLSKEQSANLDYVLSNQTGDNGEFPIQERSKDYNLDIYEIYKSTDVDTDFNGKYVLEIKQKQNRHSSTNSYSYVSEITTNDLDRLVKIAQKVNRNIAIAIDNTSRNIPEVRAGPIS